MTFAKRVEPHLVVVGNRGMGSVKRNFMSFLGLGSVSDYCSHHLKCPVLVAKFAVTEQEQAKEGEQPSGEEAEEAPAPEPAASDGVQQTQQQGEEEQAEGSAPAA